MAKGYWIAHVSVADEVRYEDYKKANALAFSKYGARFLVRGGRFESVEGQARDRHVVIEFDSYEQALACYNSPEYADAIEIRKRYSDGEVIIIEGA